MDNIYVGTPHFKWEEQPEPEETQDMGVRRDSQHPDTIVGVISLSACIAGIVLPILLRVLADAKVIQLQGAIPFVPLCFLLFVLLEVAALVCGILARRTTGGKAGAALSAVFLLSTFALSLVWAVASPSAEPAPPAAIIPGD